MTGRQRRRSLSQAGWTMTTRTFNLGTARRPFVVDVAVNPFFDLLISTLTVRDQDDRSQAYEIGTEWLEAFGASIPAGATAELDSMRGPETDHVLWLLLGLVADRAPATETVSDAVRWISDHDVRQLLAAQLCRNSDHPDIDAALAGDRAAFERLLTDAAADQSLDGNADAHIQKIKGLFEHLSPDIGPRLIEALTDIDRAAFADEHPRWASALTRSADAVAMVIAGSNPEGLIDRITNGIEFELPIGITRMVLVPSVVIRPWSMVHETGSTVVVVYPIAEEHLHDDPDAAPSWLVNYYKALGDARRLKILRRLAIGPADLSEIAELIGMAKSSTLHHIGVLRSAGLVRVHIGGAKTGTYDLRSQALFDADGLLDKYLDLSNERIDS